MSKKRIAHVNQRRADPTRTQTLRRQFTAAGTARLKQLARRIRSEVERDNFGLDSPGTGLDDLSTPAAKIEAFKRRMTDLVEGELVQGGTWSDEYIDKAFAQGVKLANTDLRRAGARPEPLRETLALEREKVEAKRTEAAVAFAGIGDEAIKRASNAFAAGVSNDEAPKTLGQRISEGILGLGSRIKAAVGATVVGAVALATLRTFTRAGVQFVGAEVEARFTTAGDDDVCPICRGLETQDNGYGPGIWLLADAFGIIPVHPNCRCRWHIVGTVSTNQAGRIVGNSAPATIVE